MTTYVISTKNNFVLQQIMCDNSILSESLLWGICPEQQQQDNGG